MKKALLLLTAAILCGVVTAGNPAAGEASETTAEQPLLNTIIGNPVVPEYFYGEIIASHKPCPRQKILIDFGQKAGFWEYNRLTDNQDRKLIFNSGMEALNYALAHGWEFVQAYTSGEDNDITHLLIRIPASRLSEQQREQLTAKPIADIGKQKSNPKNESQR